MEDILASIKRIIAEDGTGVTPPRAARRQPPPSPSPSAYGLEEDEDHEDDLDPNAIGDDGVLELTQAIEPQPQQPSSRRARLRAEPPVSPVSPIGIEPVEPAPLKPERIEPAVTAARAQVPEPVPSSASPAPTVTAPLVSEVAADASRHALAALSAMVVKPEAGEANTLEGLVREMLRPMLKDWLDQHLPELVEKLVEKEIARITGRAL